ncbi:hypothetical protein C356_06869, partial [Cryptococcus neoformans c45]
MSLYLYYKEHNSHFSHRALKATHTSCPTIQTTTQSYQGVILTGPQNYAEWELSIQTSDSSALWDELKSQYSAAVGARQTHLLQQMWTSPVMEGEDPTKRMAEIRSAHAQINSSGENLSDRMLAYAMTLALPESFTTLKQTLWLREPLTSSAVQAAVQAEWTRRSSEE